MRQDILLSLNCVINGLMYVPVLVHFEDVFFIHGQVARSRIPSNSSHTHTHTRSLHVETVSC